MKRKIRSDNSVNIKPKTPALLKWVKTFLYLGIALAIAIIIWFIYLARDLPSLDQLEQYEPDLATKIISQDSVVIKELFTQKRIFIPLEEIPDYMWQSVLATEDHTFFQHWGVNLKRFVYIMGLNLSRMRYEQGASTITQQLARQLYLGLEKKVTRKIREWITAVQIERAYTKHEILEMYLNYMNFGHGNYGVEAAAQYFYGKHARELQLDECAMLTGLLQRPTTISPYTQLDFDNPQPDSTLRAFRRRNLVLRNMRRRGIIDDAIYKESIQAPIFSKLRERSEDDEFGIAPYFTEHVRQELQSRYHMDLYKDGYSVYTTLDTRVQAAAERAVKNHLPKQQKVLTTYMINKNKIEELLDPEMLERRTYREIRNDTPFVDSLVNEKAPVQVALIAMDPENGDVLALIGGRDFGESKYNRAIQMRSRQPGSTIKPIIYTAAIDNGYPPCTELLNQPVVLYLPNGDRWAPRNYDLSKGGPTTFREALRRSLNLVTARLVQELVPPKTVVDYAIKLGLTTNLVPVDAIALGAAEVSPIEMTTAFSVFPNLGARAKPRTIIKVVDKYGNVLEEHPPEMSHVLRAETSYIMTDLLQTIMNNGTGAAARSVYQFLRPAGGKTGTTNEFTDAWFIGFTPQIVAGVWIGLDNPAMTLGPGQAGAVAALPVWAPFMKVAHDTLDLPIAYFRKPPGVIEMEICAETKQIATEFCPNIVKEIFDVKFAPTEECTKHTGESAGFSKTNKKKRIRF
ncbi:MAG: PBP1A family penicillin-binding protein [candidate division KSB1 bacterium]|jgi:penicillin-binding protein 1A|nr:PBP1A family penicillin-binding protein [candidate division KSB1 bacterium]